MAYQSFEELEVWKRSCRLAVEIYETLNTSKEYALKDQMQRADVSIASNIAEGTERGSAGDTIRFLRIAKGSAAELRTQIYIAQKLNLIPAATSTPLVTECKEISAMLQGLVKSLQAHPPTVPN